MLACVSQVRFGRIAHANIWLKASYTLHIFHGGRERDSNQASGEYSKTRVGEEEEQKKNNNQNM